MYKQNTISSDKTKQQLMEYKALKEDLKRHIEDGEDNLSIKYV